MCEASDSDVTSVYINSMDASFAHERTSNAVTSTGYILTCAADEEAQGVLTHAYR